MDKKSYYNYYEKIINHGIDIFGNEKEFYKWLKSYCKYIGDCPFNIMNNYDGLEIIDIILCIIEKKWDIQQNLEVN